MIANTKLPPCAPLAGIVRFFHAWTAPCLPAPVIYPVAASPDLFIDFCFGDRFQLAVRDTERRKDPTEALPDVYVYGPRTERRRDLVLTGTVDTFAIHFQPTGLSRLLGIPMRGLCDGMHDAISVFGNAWRILHGRLGDACDLASRKAIAEEFLLDCLDDSDRFHPYQDVASGMLHGATFSDIAGLALRSCLSTRQFERRFTDGVGVPPKQFQCVVRLTKVARAKMAGPQLSWATLAHENGFHDQMHLVRDFRRLSAATPTEFFEQIRPFAQWFL